MKINKIKKLRSGKYQIIFDDNQKLITYDEVILKYNLLYKKEIDKALFVEIEKSNGYYSFYNDSIKYLTKKVRSLKDFNKYLEKYELKEIEKKDLISDMKRLNLIDDYRFLKAYISDRVYLSNDGPLKIKNDLLNHNIDESLINEELSKIDNDEILKKIEKLINKKIRTTKGSFYMVKQKIYHDMNNLGYPKYLVDQCLNLNIDDSLSLEKDFNKFYNSYIRKEKDEDKLFLKIKQKLYQKGYELSKIDNLINKKRN